MKRSFGTLMLFFPLVLSTIFFRFPILSYLIAWAGSFFILYWTISGKVVSLPRDLPFTKQFMRPIVLNQIIFASYVALTSIFFFLNANGFFFFEYKPTQAASFGYFFHIAECQRYYLLAHLMFTIGVIMHMKYPAQQKWAVRIRSYSSFFLRAAIMFTVLRVVISVLPALGQIMKRLQAISMMSVLLSFSFAIPEKKRNLLIINGILYVINIYFSLLSGWKEQSLVLLGILGVLLYPYLKKRVIIVGIFVIIAWFTFIPYYTTVFRQQVWSEGESREEASKTAYSEVQLASQDSLATTNWRFLVHRFSEIGMFLKYIDNVPHRRGYYGFEIISQTFQMLIPRMFWKEKPNTEELVMERVYENYIVERGSAASAKPHFVVDAYLSGGWLGILIACYIYGALASIFSRIAERWFGGYILGTALIYNSLFQIFWKGSCFEFMANTALWSFIIMFAVFKFGRTFGFIIPVKRENNAITR